MKFNLVVLIVLLGVVLVAAALTSAGESNPPTGNDDGGIQSARSRFRLPKLFDFARFKSMFKKSYKSFAEELRRQKLFMARAFHTFIANIKYKHGLTSHYLRVNPMSDWTKDEQNKMKADLRDKEEMTDLNPKKEKKDTASDQGVDEAEVKKEIEEVQKHADEPGYKEIAKELKTVNPEEQTSRRRRRDVDQESGSLLGGLADKLASVVASKSPSVEPDEVYVDHRRSGCIGPVRSQGQCGSCYAFAWAAMAEYYFCKDAGGKFEFQVSPQYFVDCGNRQAIEHRGCDGSSPKEIGRFIKNFGIEREDRYSYVMRKDKCAYSRDQPADLMGEFKSKADLFIWDSDRAMVEALIAITPLVISVDTTDEDFMYYGGGITNLNNCPQKIGDHSTLLVGHGREDGKEYWLVKNSYGDYWGEDGYFKMEKDSGCLVGDYVLAMGDPDTMRTGLMASKNPNYDAKILDERHVPPRAESEY